MNMYELTQIEDELKDPEVAHLVIDGNKVLGKNQVEGLIVEPQEIENGVSVNIRLKAGYIIKKQVHLCFGVMHERALQEIKMDILIEDNAKIDILAHCMFPNAIDVIHKMDAIIKVGKGAAYTYTEKHIHSENKGIKVYPKAKIYLDEGAVFKTTFELIMGRVGIIDIDYEMEGKAFSTMEMDTRISGYGDDSIKVNEKGKLIGEGAKGVLTSRIAVRENASASIYNTLIATAPYTRGHVDCKEIVQDNGSASAVPVVEVRHPKAHITHEAAIGSVDTKQLETLMARGLSEDEAIDLIIQGLLRG